MFSIYPYEGGWGVGGGDGGWGVAGWGGGGVFIKGIKDCRVIPLFKSDNCMLVISYRTVSV